MLNHPKTIVYIRSTYMLIWAKMYSCETRRSCSREHDLAYMFINKPSLVITIGVLVIEYNHTQWKYKIPLRLKPLFRIEHGRATHQERPFSSWKQHSENFWKYKIKAKNIVIHRAINIGMISTTWGIKPLKQFHQNMKNQGFLICRLKHSKSIKHQISNTNFA